MGDDIQDYELVELAQQGNKYALESIFERYHPLIQAATRKYFVPNMGSDDVEIEAMIGLWKAIESYRKDRGCLFSTFAPICVRGQLLNLLKKTKNMQFTTLTEDNVPSSDNPEDMLISKEILHNILPVLSKLERKILSLRLKGYSYKGIAARLGINTKSVDNGLRRLRAKAKLVVFHYLPKE